jgi:hypothetical protein
LREWLAANVARNDGIGPHRSASGEIFQPMAAQAQSLGFEDGNFDGGTNRACHDSPRSERSAQK